LTENSSGQIIGLEEHFGGRIGVAGAGAVLEGKRIRAMSTGLTASSRGICENRVGFGPCPALLPVAAQRFEMRAKLADAMKARLAPDSIASQTKKRS
jgi:hypothetical protein